MALSSGTRLGPYEILTPLGAGGMGEVYRARDSRLGRDVALKVLPEAFSRDAERMARFEREAQVLASLNHPNIAALYGLEESEGIRALVMELVEGPTLAERIAAGPAPLEEALPIARQIAEAFEAAHERGIVHRDLKPANVKVTPEGKVKVLDFGLAKALESEPSAADLSHSPTMSMSPTRAGVILGTAAYMSPEQARGKQVDRRTDIWAFGCVLYELLTGRSAFGHGTFSDTSAAILMREPDWGALPENTPGRIRDLLRRCLQKDQPRRLRDIGDARLEIEEVLAGAPEPAREAGPAGRSRPRKLAWLVAGFAAGALAAGAAAWFGLRAKPPAQAAVKRFAITLPANERLVADSTQLGLPVIALSPDGTRLAYASIRDGVTRLYLQRMDQFEAALVPGTEGAEGPFFSPDGEWLAFVSQHSLKKVSMQGGTPQTLSTDAVQGATWTAENTVLYTPNQSSGLWRMSAAGGEAQAVTKLDPKETGTSHRWPQLLPGGQAILFAAGLGPFFFSPSIHVQALNTGARRKLIDNGNFPRYAPSGHLVFARDGVLMASPFNARRLEVTGPAVSIIEGVLVSPFSGAYFAVADDGTLAYAPGPPGGSPNRESTLVLADRNGAVQALTVPTRRFGDPRLSPDGRRLAVQIRESLGIRGNIWVYDVGRGTLTRVTFETTEDETPSWSPDGKQVAYSQNTAPQQGIYVKNADGTGAKERLLPNENHMHLGPWSADGKWLAYTEIHPTTNEDIWVLNVADRKAVPFLRTPFNELQPTFSPDARWIAYTSDESGRAEVYVQSFQGPGGKWQISTDGGIQPVWSRDGREIFYRDGEKIMAVAVDLKQSGFGASKPRLLFEGRYEPGANHTSYDVTPDGKRFLFMRAAGSEAAPIRQIQVVLNWFEELQRRAPPGKN